MRLLIGVKSCSRDLENGSHEVIRQTWGRDVQGADLRFFIGRGEISKADEVAVDAPDDYDSLPLKTREILRWSIVSRYDFTFLCDTDTFVVPSKLMTCGFDSFDVSGRFNGHDPKDGPFHYRDERGEYPLIYPWPSGGWGYFISKAAAEIVVANDPNVWAEDMYVGQALGPDVVSGKIKARHLLHLSNCVSWHHPGARAGLEKPISDWMKSMQERYGKK